MLTKPAATPIHKQWTIILLPSTKHSVHKSIMPFLE